MPNALLYVRSTRAAVREIVRQLPEAATSGSDGREIMERVARATLKQIHSAFLIKANGGTDICGVSWPPLPPKTIAYRMSNRGRRELKRVGRPSSALTKKQQEKWWTYYKQGLARFRGDKGHAARSAWWRLKREGGITLLDKYGNKKVKILIDSEQLVRSLSPEGSPDQIFRVSEKSFTIGTRRRGALENHTGNPARHLPQRKLWPEPRDWNADWWDAILEETKRALLELATRRIQENRP